MIDAYGIQIPTEEEILARVKARIRGQLDPALDLSAESPEGAIIVACVEQIRSMWEGIAARISTLDYAQSFGVWLDMTAGLLGISRRPATQTEIPATVTLSAGTTLRAGVASASVLGYPERVATITADITAPSSGDYPVTFRMVEFGPLEVPPNTLTVISTSVSGWSAVTNATAGTTGTITETDDELKRRIRQSPGGAGRGTIPSMRADLLAAGGVYSVGITENTTWNHIGTLPPKSYEVMIYADPSLQNDTIAQLIFDASVDGYTPVGTDGGTATMVGLDGLVSVPIAFSRPSEVSLWARYTLSPGSVVLRNIPQAIVDRMQPIDPGVDVLLDVAKSAIYSCLSGESRVLLLEVSTDGIAWSAGDVTIGDREKAVWSIGRITEI